MKKAVQATTSPSAVPDFHDTLDASIGVELELQVLDRDTSDLAPGAVPILKACAEEGISSVSAELMQSMIEIKTGICRDVAEVRAELVQSLRRVGAIARSLGYELAMAGTHPFHRTSQSVVFPAERYERLMDRLAWIIQQRVVFGLHVHVGVPGGDATIGILNLCVQYLPHLLALSANSPFWQGVDTGLQSCRAALYRLLPHAGVPRYFRNWQEFRRFYRVMKACKTIHSFKDIYWDIRPRPDLGTIEFRICDMPPTLSDTLALVALIRSLVTHSWQLLQEHPPLRSGDVRRQWITIENKWLATRYGLSAMYIRSPSGKRRQLGQEAEQLIERLLPVAQLSGDDTFLAGLLPSTGFESGAERQRRIYRETGDWKAVTADLKQRLARELESES